MNSIAIAAMIAASATPAAPQGTVRSAPAITAPAQTEGGSPGTKGRRYCVRGTLTGSRIMRETCRTREAWLAEGFDPLSPNGR